jgi:hypothetical protein
MPSKHKTRVRKPKCRTLSVSRADDAVRDACCYSLATLRNTEISVQPSSGRITAVRCPRENASCRQVQTFGYPKTGVLWRNVFTHG